MEHNKDIGKAFREKLDQLDKSPGDHVWASIEADLPKKKKRRFPFWLFFATIFVVTLLYFGSDGFEKNPFGSMPSVNNGKTDDSQQRKNTGGSLNGSDDTFHPGTVVDSNEVTPSDSNSGLGSADKSSAGEDDFNRSSKTVKSNTRDVRNSDGFNPEKNRSGKKFSKINNTGKNQVASEIRKGKKQGRKNVSSKTALESGSNAFSKAADSDNATAGNSNPGRNISDKNTSSLSGENANGSKSNNPNASAGLAQPKDATGEQAKELTSKDSIPKEIAKKDAPKEKPKDSTKTITVDGKDYCTFSVFVYGAPTYYNRFSSISSIDRSLDSIQGKAQITFNYGGYFCLDYDEKWSVRFGIARTDLKYVTKDIPVSSLPQNYYNVEYKDGVTNQVVAGQFANSQYFDLVQDVSYLEFPIELKYKFFDKSVDIMGIGGVSTLFIKQNSVTAEADNNGGSIIIGSTRNLSKAYFSANLGVGFSYSFARNLKFNVEPIFKYHFRTSSVAMRPYSVLVQAGIEYTFNSRSRKKTVKD